MLKADKAKKIISILNKIYPETPIPLNHKNNFELLISVLLSAQCTDKRVNEVTPSLFEKANSPAKMEKLSIKTIYNMEGKIVHEITPNQIFIVVYSDNSTKKIFVNDL